MRALCFVRDRCPNCPPVKRLLEEHGEDAGLEVEWVDCDVQDGLGRAIEMGVKATPTVVFLRDDGAEAGRAHSVHELKRLLANFFGLVS